MSVRPSRRPSGASLIEVLVALLVVAIGLLSLGVLQSKLQAADIDSYQRAQAMLLLEDISSRITVNRSFGASYVTGSGNPVGTGMTCTTNVSTRANIDLGQWCNALQGTSETAGALKRGAMVGARGCVEDLGDSTYLISVVWQGLSPVVAPGNSTACGAGLYNVAGTSCTADRCRRILTSVVRIAPLE